MAYRVLIADDEPIILSGIRHLIQWEEADAQIVAAAANGQEAYSLIESEHPDIVITDIRMPVIDGLALAGRCSEEHPDIVFIILTSLAEFSLAKEAIGYGISDYLLKTELDSGKLMDALLKAEEECRRRREGMMRSSPDPENRTAAILSSLMIMRDVTPETRSYLSEHGLLGDSAIIASAFAFPSPSLEKQWSAEDYAKLHDWEKDIVEKILSSSFASFWPVVPVAGKAGTLIYFVKGIADETWRSVVSRLESRIASASSMVTGLEPRLMASDVIRERDDLRTARAGIEQSLMGFYLDKEGSLSPSPLDVDTVFPRLESAISEKESVGCRACFSLLRRAVEDTDHSLGQFSFLVAALRSAISSGLSSIGLQNDGSVIEAFSAVDYIMKRSEALSFLDDVQNSLLSLLGLRGGPGGNVADKAREYVLAHINERISLGDVADYACVSPGYMSKSFKRIMGVSLVDYISTMKIARAKEMMEESRSERIADIALALGFSNIYYFSKVFRKVEGMTPSEYMRRIQDR